MAENILGLLLVTSSSRGRHVFRYPPDPASPNVRLAQPIYPSATFTAADPDIEYRVPRAGGLGGKRRPYEDRSSNASIRRSLYGPSTRGSSRKDKGKKKKDDLHARYMNPLVEGNGSDFEEDSEQEDSSSSEEDSDDFVHLWKTAGLNGVAGDGSAPKRQASGDDSLKATSGLRSIDQSTIFDASRRGSTSTTTATVTITGPGGEEHSELKKERDKVIESQYNYALGWPLEVLSDMLTPPRSACNRKFELCVGNVVFLGHPVCSGPDGKWEYPAEDDELDDRVPSRGRRMRGDHPGNGLGSLDTVVEGNEAYTATLSPAANAIDTKRSSQSSNKENEGEDDVPSLTMFHLVLIIDKPDPKPGTESHDEHHSQTLGIYDEIYREIAFKWTAAAFRLQCESNLVAKEAWMIAKYKDKCLAEGISITECCRWTASHSQIDRTLNYLYLRLHQLRTQPANGLHSSLPTTITNHLADMTIQTVLSPRPVNADESWAHWGEMDGALSESESESSEDDYYDDPTAGIRRPELVINPWQTLLLVDDDAAGKADEISFAIIGLSGVEEEVASLGLSPGVVKGRPRRGSRVTLESTAEEDERALMKDLIEACDVTKTLSDIAHLLRFDLEGIVIPLARELVQNKRAILIDVINPRLRTVVMPTTIDEHTTSFDQYSARFTREFPDLPSFASLISSISLSPVPFRNIIPGTNPSAAIRQRYMSALLWLLKQDLVVQVHTRARVFARKEVKVEAWKRLWKRRRERWLEAHKEREAEPEPVKPHGDSDVDTPRAWDTVHNPLETPAAGTVPPPHGGVAASWRPDQSYLDYDPALEMDSDEEFDGLHGTQKFSVEVEHPSKGEIPVFESTFIFKPARAQKDEARWLRVIREAADAVWASKFDLFVQYFDGVTTFDEISYRTGLPKKELEKILQLYNSDVVTFLHP
ncbi:hypothetical protein IAT38_003249 [Cryptococcus sp. DSM 104549]